MNTKPLASQSRYPGPGALSTRTVDDKLRELFSVKDFGAVGDGSTDDTTTIQNAINAIPNGAVLDGGGLLYLVTSCNLKSNMTLQNFRFKTKAGSADFVSPVTIGTTSSSSSLSNIVVRNVSVDGNRINQTNVGGSGLGEDGGRHGFRIIGRVENLLIDNCSATYCATDGIEIFSAGASSTAWPRLVNITVQNSLFNWNRRHGGSGDSIDGVSFINCQFNDNGQDLNTTDPLSSGGRGARVGANLYGNGFDMETYGAGTHVKNVLFEGCQAVRNVRMGILFFDPSNPAAAGFVANNNLCINRCWLDSGTINSENNGLSFTSSSGYEASGKFFKNVFITDCKIEGLITLRAADGVTINGGSVTGYSTGWLTLIYSLNVAIGSPLTSGKSISVNGACTYTTTLADTPFVWKGVRATLAAGATLDLGLVRSITQGLMTVYASNGTYPSGGAWAAQVYLAGGGGAAVHNISNTSVVTTETANTLKIVSDQTNWQIKNNWATPITFTYLVQL